jgi:superfamily II DNA or RNA helicase
MSRKILLTSLSDQERTTISDDLRIRIEPSDYERNAQIRFIYPYDMTDDHIFIPFGYDRRYKRPLRKNLVKMDVLFEGELRNYQLEVRDESIKHFNKYGSTIVSCYPGWGKTAFAIYTACKLQLTTLILVHRIVLIKQWKSSIARFCPGASVQFVTSKSNKQKCDFYIMNAENVCKMGREFFDGMGLLIVDECHLMMAEMLSKSMQFVVPRYLLGLSATPYRTDGLDPLINIYFGERRIHRKLYREHKVYRVNTNFTPEMELAKNGRVKWGSVLDSQANDIDRNELIIRIVKHFKNKVFLILVKRIEQGKYLVRKLKENGEDVTSLLGVQQEYEHDSRILVGTTGKCSVGFDHPRLNAMIMAADILQYFVQVLGRIMRTQSVVPLVFDLVDDNGILLKHYRERRAVYIEHGGTIHNFNKEYPNIKMC